MGNCVKNPTPVVSPSDVTVTKPRDLPKVGWTRICHSDCKARKTTGATLIWDMPMNEVEGLAGRASRVRIQQKDNPVRYVVSKPYSYPIKDIRRRRPIGYAQYLTEQSVRDHWEAPEMPQLIPSCLWHASSHWQHVRHQHLLCNIYVSFDNPGGIHWDSETCGWSEDGSDDLELYIDTGSAEPSGAMCITALYEVNRETISELQVSRNSTIGQLRTAVMKKACLPDLPQLMLNDIILEVDSTTLQAAGIVDGGIVLVCPPRLPGWTRICHGDSRACKSTGAKLIWDMPMVEVMALAERASRVRIQQKDHPACYVVSKPYSYPIKDIRRRRPIGYTQYMGEQNVKNHWEAPDMPELVPGRMWHACSQWQQGGFEDLATNIYHSFDNAKGLHWDSQQCSWSEGVSDDLELYIDATPV